MTSERQWSYAELTAAAEKEIRFFGMMAVPALDREGRHGIAARAFGAFFFWDSLTSAYQREGDKERLRALVDAITA